MEMQLKLVTMKHAIQSLILVYCLASIKALDYKGIEEYFNCEHFEVDPSLQIGWMFPVPYWYTTFWNKVDCYQNAEDFFGSEEFSKMKEQDLKKTCAYYRPNGTSIPIHGFDGRILNYESFPDPIRTGIAYWSVTKNGKREYHATTYIIKTDNKTYFLAITVWSNGLKGFNVGSTVPKLDQQTLIDIKSRLIKMGFKQEHFVEQDYSDCPPPPMTLVKQEL